MKKQKEKKHSSIYRVIPSKYPILYNINKIIYIYIYIYILKWRLTWDLLILGEAETIARVATVTTKNAYFMIIILVSDLFVCFNAEAQLQQCRDSDVLDCCVVGPERMIFFHFSCPMYKSKPVSYRTRLFHLAIPTRYISNTYTYTPSCVTFHAILLHNENIYYIYCNVYTTWPPRNEWNVTGGEAYDV